MSESRSNQAKIRADQQRKQIIAAIVNISEKAEAVFGSLQQSAVFYTIDSGMLNAVNSDDLSIESLNQAAKNAHDYVIKNENNMTPEQASFLHYYINIMEVLGKAKLDCDNVLRSTQASTDASELSERSVFYQMDLDALDAQYSQAVSSASAYQAAQDRASAQLQLISVPRLDDIQDRGENENNIAARSKQRLKECRAVKAAVSSLAEANTIDEIEGQLAVLEAHVGVLDAIQRQAYHDYETASELKESVNQCHKEHDADVVAYNRAVLDLQEAHRALFTDVNHAKRDANANQTPNATVLLVNANPTNNGKTVAQAKCAGLHQKASRFSRASTNKQTTAALALGGVIDDAFSELSRTHADAIADQGARQLMQVADGLQEKKPPNATYASPASPNHTYDYDASSEELVKELQAARKTIDQRKEALKQQKRELQAQQQAKQDAERKHQKRHPVKKFIDSKKPKKTPSLMKTLRSLWKKVKPKVKKNPFARRRTSTQSNYIELIPQGDASSNASNATSYVNDTVFGRSRDTRSYYEKTTQLFHSDFKQHCHEIDQIIGFLNDNPPRVGSHKRKITALNDLKTFMGKNRGYDICVKDNKNAQLFIKLRAQYRKHHSLAPSNRQHKTS